MKSIPQLLNEHYMEIIMGAHSPGTVFPIQDLSKIKQLNNDMWLVERSAGVNPRELIELPNKSTIRIPLQSKKDVKGLTTDFYWRAEDNPTLWERFINFLGRYL